MGFCIHLVIPLAYAVLVFHRSLKSTTIKKENSNQGKECVFSYVYSQERVMLIKTIKMGVVPLELLVLVSVVNCQLNGITSYHE